MSKITDFSPDPRNANKGTGRGLDMLKTSLREYGAGRSLLLDKHGVVIAGNKTLEAAASVGIERVRVVETDGTEIIAVKRIDLDLAEDARAKALAVADNRVSEVGLAWDSDVLREIVASGTDLGGMFSQEELAAIVHEFSVDTVDAPTLRDGDRLPFQQMTFTIHDDQAEEIRAAIAKAKSDGYGESSINENSNGNALAFICGSFLRG